MTRSSRNADDWLIREIRLYLKRTLKRLDVSSRSLFALIEPGSCFCGTLLELALASDRAYMLRGLREGDESMPASIGLTEMNFGATPMCNGLTRLESRFQGTPERVEELRGRIGEQIDASLAEQLGLVTFTPDDIDWDDEVRIAHRRTRGVLVGRADRDGGFAPIRRAGNDRVENICASVGVAELDLSAPERGR